MWAYQQLLDENVRTRTKGDLGVVVRNSDGHVSDQVEQWLVAELWREGAGLGKLLSGSALPCMATGPSWFAHGCGSLPPLYKPPLLIGHTCCSATPLAGDTLTSASPGWRPSLGFLTIAPEPGAAQLQILVSRGARQTGHLGRQSWFPGEVRASW